MLETPRALFDYFHDQVESAGAGLPLSGEIKLYLANLLTERTRADRKTYEESTLAELYGRAYNAPRHHAAVVYRELGDRALYVVGFFPDSLQRSLVGPRYYIDMGASAYYRTHDWFQGAFGSTFADLSRQFEDCVVLLDTVRGTEHDLSLLVEEWHTTGDTLAKKKLFRAGLIVTSSDVES